MKSCSTYIDTINRLHFILFFDDEYNQKEPEVDCRFNEGGLILRHSNLEGLLFNFAFFKSFKLKRAFS